MTTAAELALIGGNLALDFANTAGWHASDEHIERLTSYGELLAWCRHAGVLTPAQSRRLEGVAAKSPARATRTVKHAIVVREVIYRIFAQIARGGIPDASDLELLQREYVAALAQATAEWDGSAVKLDWQVGDDLQMPLYPIAVAAMRLLEAPPPGRVRQCGNDPCGWLFVDTSRSGTRRWCSSAECGNQVRVR
ncbi:MAG TPA: ABATE domain-containing protein, partial [Gemmatimonadales bacterium]|nr:ABATE domain-containing protein [Gemmatimonadales bacterium]